MKSDRTNSITKGREEATLKKIGRMKMWFGNETVAIHGGEGAEGGKKGKKSIILLHWRGFMGKTKTLTFGFESEGKNFLSSYNL